MASEDQKGALGLNRRYLPSEPLIDFIFVHGLRGGSRKTWSMTNSVTHYWPQEWLPKYPTFKKLYAYIATGEMSVSPYLGDTDMPMADMPIVLIGHSMSGLVIKKAYLLASQDSAHKTLAKRVRTFYFYVTPHRGSDWAKLLNNVLRCVYSSRAYVADLKRNSETIQSTNDEFRNYSNDLNLWSFYETQKVTLGVFRTFIVDADS
ncbi:hypothetical protein MMC14_007274, partial [Varicellaria rhodocarpa]|nr:hypothetical protein [Varicellaria rhodocarpa]